MLKKSLFALALAASMYSCTDEARPTQASEYRPLLMDRGQLEQSVTFQSPRDMRNPGKIYAADGYVYISESYKGVHVIDNHDPRNPVNVGFISAPGCLDMAMKDRILYIDNSVDLVAVDVTSPKAPNTTSRVQNVFPALVTPDMKPLAPEYSQQRWPANTVCVGWEKITK